MYQFYGGYFDQFAHETAVSIDYLGVRNRKDFGMLNINPIVNGGLGPLVPAPGTKGA